MKTTPKFLKKLKKQQKLKRCPFCGSSSVSMYVGDLNPFHVDAVTQWPIREVCITCNRCHISVLQKLGINPKANPSLLQIKTFASARWNKRYNSQ